MAILSRPVKWFLGSSLVILAGIALVLHKLLGSEKLGHAAVGAIEAAHKPKIDELNQRIADLSTQFSSNQAAIEKAQSDVESRKNDLVLVYRTTGMNENEVMSRLSKMKV